MQLNAGRGAAQMRSLMVCLDWRQRVSSFGQLQQNKRRDEKYRFDDDEVFKGLLLALLSNGID
jgi:hypothetical protein